MWTRRTLLKTGGLALVSLGGASRVPRIFERTASAILDPDSVQRRKTLVTVFLRGGMDGLMAVPPLDDDWLRKLRPRLALPATTRRGRKTAIDLGVGFGLHPAFAPLLPLWKDRHLGIVHAVGLPEPTRSHFDAQEQLETGTSGQTGTPSGWLNRVSGLLQQRPSPWRSLAIGPVLPRSLCGDEPALAVTDLSDLQTLRTSRLRTTAAGEGTWEPPRRRITRQLERGSVQTDGYPRSRLGRGLRQIALLIRAEVGLEIAFVQSGGWDTHIGQGTTRGIFARRAADLARSLAAFWTDVGAYRDDVTLLTMTEFGRTARENDGGGTDHGHGSCLFVLGGRVDGGKVHGRLPVLDPAAVTERRDLPVTTDFRSVLSEVAGKHLGVTDPRAIFPGWTGRPLPLLES